MANKEKSDGVFEVTATAPRMGAMEKYLYDRKQMTPKQKKEEALDTAVGFSGSIHMPKIDLRKMSNVKRTAIDFLTKASSGADNVAKAATGEDKKYARGGRIDGVAQRGKTKGRMR
jgi:hypothetical protein